MRLNCRVLLTFVSMLFFLAAPALAAPYQFVFTTAVDPGPTIPGVTGGDTLTVTVVVDNGGTSLLSQQWFIGDVVSSTASVGTYSAVYSAPHSYLVGTGGTAAFQTSATGVIEASNYFNISPNNTDTFSPTANSNTAFYSNAITDSQNRAAIFPTRNYQIPTGWSVSSAKVPVLGALGLFVLVAGLVLGGTRSLLRSA
jgi:hypothetical protein